MTYQKLLHYSNSLKQVLNARLLFLIPVFFLVADSNPKGIPSRTDHLVGTLEVQDLLLVTVILKPNLSELTLVQKKHRIPIPFFVIKPQNT